MRHGLPISTPCLSLSFPGITHSPATTLLVLAASVVLALSDEGILATEFKKLLHPSWEILNFHFSPL